MCIRDRLEVTQECLNRGIAAALRGNRLGDIGSAVQTYAESYGYGVVREYVAVSYTHLGTPALNGFGDASDVNDLLLQIQFRCINTSQKCPSSLRISGRLHGRP